MSVQDWLAYWLKGWTKLPLELHQALSELSTAPLERLQLAPISFRPLKLFPISTFLPPLAFFLFYLMSDQQIGWGIAGALFAVLLIAAGWWTYQVRLEMHAEGVVICCRTQEIICPWELFTASGASFEKGMWMYLPINPEFAEHVELTKKNKAISSGWTVQTDFFRFEDGHCLKLINGFNVPPEVIRHWLHFAANAICRDSVELNPSGTEVKRLATGADLSAHVPPTTSAYRSSRSSQQRSIIRDSDPVEIKDGNRITLHVTRLVFPDECCICGATPDGSLSITAPTVLSLFAFGNRYTDIEIPACRRCRRHEFLRAAAGLTLAYAADVAIIGAALAVFLGGTAGNFTSFALVTFFLSVLPARWVISLGPRMLVRVKAWYSPSRRAVTFEFGNGVYVQKTANLAWGIQSTPGGKV